MDKLPKIGQYENGWNRIGHLRVDVRDGYEFPRGYGLAYYSYQSRYAVCYPLLLNWVVWIFREIWLILVSTPHNGIERKSYLKGVVDGTERGLELAKLEQEFMNGSEPKGVVLSQEEILKALKNE